MNQSDVSISPRRVQNASRTRTTVTCTPGAQKPFQVERNRSLSFFRAETLQHMPRKRKRGHGWSSVGRKRKSSQPVWKNIKVRFVCPSLQVEGQMMASAPKTASKPRRKLKGFKWTNKGSRATRRFKVQVDDNEIDGTVLVQNRSKKRRYPGAIRRYKKLARQAGIVPMTFGSQLVHKPVFINFDTSLRTIKVKAKYQRGNDLWTKLEYPVLCPALAIYREQICTINYEVVREIGPMYYL